MKQILSIFGTVLVVAFWAAVFYFTGAFGFIEGHARQIVLTCRFAVVALGPFTFVAMFLFVGGKANKIAQMLLTPFWLIAWIAISVFEVGARIPVRILGFFAEMSAFFLVWMPLVAWLGAYAAMSSPIIGYLAGVCLALLLIELGREKQSSSQSQLVIETLRSILLPIGFGLTLVCWMQVIFNLFDRDVQSIRLIENHIGYLSKQSKVWVDFSLPSTIALTLSLMFITLLLPQIRAVTRAEKVKNILHAVAAVIACVSSFTFFAQAPFKYQDHQETKRLEAERKEDTNRNDLRLVAAQSIQRSLREMSPEDRDWCRERFTEMFSEINELTPYREHGRLIEAMAQHTVQNAPNSADISSALFTLEKKVGFDPTAAGADEILRQSSDPDFRPSDELLAGVGSLFGDLVGAMSPEIKGVAGKFVESLIDKEADFFFDAHIRPILRAHLDDILPITSAFSASLIADRPSNEPVGSMWVDVAKEIEKVREEVKVEQQRVEEEDGVKEESAPREDAIEP
jgi:hypothetical protein